MGKSTCCPTVDIDWGVSAESSDLECDEDDFDEELQSLYFSAVIPKLQFRKDVSVARWDNELGMAEVIMRKGRMWTTTGIVREEKIFCLIEEILFMVEHGTLLLLSGDMKSSMQDVYSLLMDGKYGCTWDDYQAYSHLKGLGYIVGRHGIPWTLKPSKYKPMLCSLVSSEVQEIDSGMINRDVAKEVINCFHSGSVILTDGNKRMLVNEGDCCRDFHKSTTQPVDCNTEKVYLETYLEKLSICKGSSNSQDHEKGLKLVFDVYLPYTKFKKSAPGLPNFILCIARDCPPNKNEVQALQFLCEEIPLKFAFNECGRVSFFSFDSVQLPSLP